ncbi:hypothetical protein ABBQ32_013885 [Trebouxia sp. C0010 RCD-2024]
MFGNSVVSADQTGHPVVAADQSNIISQDPESLLEAWRTAIADSEVDIDLLRQLLQSAAGLQVFQNFDVSELRSACHSCSKVFVLLEGAAQGALDGKQMAQAGLQLAPGVMQALLLNYSSLGSEAASLQSHVADAAAAFLKLAKVALLSKEWLCLAGAEGWAPIASLFRGAVKDSIMPLLCSLATEDTSSGRHVILEPYEQLVNIGRLSADIIAGKLQDSQAKELRSFALLNLTWSSIVRLLQVLATVPNQPCITTGFHVSRLLQLLISYVRQQFDTVLEDKLLNQLKVVRFWAQHVIKLVSAFESVRHSIWSSLAALLAHIHAHMPPVRSAAP